jgi:hypothetical protein
MRPPVRWLIVSTAIIALAGVAVWKGSPKRVALSGGRELRVLRVSLGTNHVFSNDPVWKQTLRRVLPQAWQKPLGPFQGHRFQTQHDSLVVCVSEFDVKTGRPLNTSLDQPAALFPDGFIAKGRKRSLQGIVGCLEFSCFARESKEVLLQVRDGLSVVTFTVANPRPARAARWQPQPFPQTNKCRHTEIVLTGYRIGGGEIRAHVNARALGDTRMGWTSWSVTAFDPLGNWSADTWPLALPVPSLPPGQPTTKFLVEGREYISAGFVPHPATGSCVVLAPNFRAQDLGVRFLMLAGRGSYRITNGLLARASYDPVSALTRPLMLLSGKTAGTNWVLELATPVPGILCFSEPSDAAVGLSARLRERIDANGGRIFPRSHSNSTEGNPVKGSKLVASFFAARLPDSTTNLEVEIIASLPAAEFFASPTTF